MAATSVKKVENKTARRGFLKWAKSRKGQQTLIILAFTIIPLVLLAAFTYVPFAEMVKFSFYKMKYSTPVDKRVFVGWKNYIEVFRNKDIFASLWLSLYYMVGSVVQLALALFLATILSFKTRGGNLFKGLMFFPYLISGIAIGYSIPSSDGLDLNWIVFRTGCAIRRSTTGHWLQLLSGDISATTWCFLSERSCL